MNHASAGNAPGLPNDPHAYFHSPQFHARMRSLDEAMRQGVRIGKEQMVDHLGCRWDDFIAYAQANTEPDGVTWIEVGNGEFITMEMGLRPSGMTMSERARYLVANNPHATVPPAGGNRHARRAARARAIGR